MRYSLDEIDVVIFCGGRGERLRSVISDNPKVLAGINGRAFLDILLDNLLHFGFKRIILSVGYKKEKIMKHFADRVKETRYTLLFSEEEIPLGTGGALKKTEPLIKSSTFLVMNGDSFCDVDFNELLHFHIKKETVLTMVLAQTKKIQDYGSVKLDNSCRIVSFREKNLSGEETVINAGIYLMQKEIFRKMPDADAFSLEYDFFSKIKEFGCYGYLTDSELIDIGTPERYEEAKVFFRNKIG